MKICTIVGARPQFIKAAAVSRAIAAHNRQTSNIEPRTLNEVILHTGQHYDDGMSAVFFRELEIPEPKYNLAIGSGAHGVQTGQMLAAIEKVLIEEKPDWVLIYGDTNSTLAGALAAAKLHVPIAHVEAGLRSFNRRMPEEINRVVADQLSTLLFCPSQVAVDNLAAEGIGGNAMVRQAHHDTYDCHPELVEGRKIEKDITYQCLKTNPLPLTSHPSPLTPHVLNVGDVMADALQFAAEKAATKAAAQYDILARLGLKPRGYLLATLHRAENTDDPERLGNIMNALTKLAEKEPVILPLHPRTRKILARTLNLEHRTLNLEPRTLNVEHRTLNVEHRTLNREPFSRLTFLDPVGYFDIIALEKSARMLLTDSGGMQKEAYWLKVPCVTLRDETEWVETVEAGWNVLTGADDKKIINAAQNFTPPQEHPPLYGDGQAAEKILDVLCQKA